MREFLRELLLRHERVTDAMIRQLAENTRSIEATTRSIEANTRSVEEQRVAFAEQLREQRREFADEMRAQRAALFRMLDRLEGGGAGPAPA